MSPRRRWTIVALVVLSAGWMVVDGARALVVGDYFTVDGELGPWSALVAAVGVPPRSAAMKWFFVVYGAAWLACAALFATGRLGRRPMIGLALGASWYLVPGTVLSLIQLGLLARPDAPPADAAAEEPVGARR